MSVSSTVNVIESALFVQGDARDPLGVWGARESLTGDATGGSVKVSVQVPADKAGAFIYTCYSVNIALVSGNAAAFANPKCRLLTNWPDIDSEDGVQAYGSLQFGVGGGSGNFTPPIAGINNTLIGPNDRFILLFDPRQSSPAFNILELEAQVNTDTDVYSFECWGYYWDRSVLNVPGGLRHPGSN